MLSPRLEQAAVAFNRKTVVIWSAMLGASLIYGVIGYLMLSRGSKPPRVNAPVPVLYSVVTLAALAGCAAGFYVSRATLGKLIRGEPLGLTTDGVAMPRPPVELAGADRELYQRLASYQTAMIVRWAGIEAVAVCGLVLTMITRAFVPVVVGSVIAAALLLSQRPRPVDFLDACQTNVLGRYQK